MKNYLIKTAIRLILGSCILITACSKGSGSGYGSNTNNYNSPGSSTSSGNNISISGMKFGSGSFIVKAGTTVTWTNKEYMTHTVTADDNSFTSGDLNYGDSYSRTFSSAGSFPYHCKYHSSMLATVTVN